MNELRKRRGLLLELAIDLAVFRKALAMHDVPCAQVNEMTMRLFEQESAAVRMELEQQRRQGVARGSMVKTEVQA